uniref:Glycoprotein n=1 Tax=Trematomus arenavirus TaxID=3138838 RepID=A0AAU7LKP9_9VIRU
MLKLQFLSIYLSADMFESIIHSVCQWAQTCMQAACCAMILFMIITVFFKMRNLPLIFMLFPSTCHAMVANIEVNAVKAEMTFLELDWTCGHILGIATDDGLLLQMSGMGGLTDTLLKGCDVELRGPMTKANCFMKPPVLMNPTEGLFLSCHWQCGKSRECNPRKGCQEVLEITDLCGRNISSNYNLTMTQKVSLCRQSTTGYRANGTVYGTLKPPTGTDDKLVRYHEIKRRSCLCDPKNLRTGPVEPPFEVFAPSGSCWREETLAHCGGAKPCCIPNYGAATNLLYFMFRALNYGHDITMVNHTGHYPYESYTMTPHYRDMYKKVAKKGLTCFGEKHLNKDVNGECFPKSATCEGGCFSRKNAINPPKKRVSRGASMNQYSVFLFDLWGMSSTDPFDDTELNAAILEMARVEDVNSGRLDELERKVGILGNVMLQGFCGNGTHTARGHMMVEFNDGEKMEVRDWCSPGVFTSFMNHKPIAHSELSGLVKHVIETRIKSKEMSEIGKTTLWFFGMAFCMFLMKYMVGMEPFSSSHYHVHDRTSLCTGPHRFLNSFQRNCHCGEIVVRGAATLIKCKCNERHVVPGILRNPVFKSVAWDNSASSTLESLVKPEEMEECSPYVTMTFLPKPESNIIEPVVRFDSQHPAVQFDSQGLALPKPVPKQRTLISSATE